MSDTTPGATATAERPATRSTTPAPVTAPVTPRLVLRPLRARIVRWAAIDLAAVALITAGGFAGRALIDGEQQSPPSDIRVRTGVWADLPEVTR